MGQNQTRTKSSSVIVIDTFPTYERGFDNNNVNGGNNHEDTTTSSGFCCCAVRPRNKLLNV